MLVAIDASPAVRPEPSGTEVYAQEIIQALAGSGTQHVIRLYANATAPPDWIPRGVEWHGIPFPRLWTHMRFAHALARDPPDVVFVPSHVLPVRLGVPGVVTIHDVGHRVERHTYTFGAWWYLELTTRYMARRAARLVAVSGNTAGELIRLYRVPSDRIAVIHPGVSSHLRPPAAATVESLRRRYALAQAYFLYVGRAHPRKNLPMLLQAFSEARRRRLQADLILAGPGHHPTGVEGVRTLAYVPASDMPALYGGALALVLPSLYEGFGFPALEAMRCGTPVMASSAGSLPEVVGNAGILLSPRNLIAWSETMLQVSSDRELRQRLIDMGLSWSGQFTWQRTADQTWKVLEQACAPASRYPTASK